MIPPQCPDYLLRVLLSEVDVSVAELEVAAQRAMYAAQEKLLHRFAALGVRVAHVEKPNGMPTAEHPIVMRGNGDQKLASLWFEPGEHSLQVVGDVRAGMFDHFFTTLEFRL